MELVKRVRRNFSEDKMWSSLSLVHFNAEREMNVASDARNYRIRAVLLYKFEDGTSKPMSQELCFRQRKTIS